MKVALVHFTDIHFTIKTDLNAKIHPFCQALIKDLRGINNAYLILSGDIAFSGKEEEYEKAKKFISTITQLIVAQLTSIVIKYIIVPGNHDCNFEKFNTQARRNAIENINYQTIGNDNSVFELCLKVQSEFWQFYSGYNSIPVDKMFYQFTDNVEGKKIIFNCINSAWMSKIDEKPGTVFFPSKTYSHESDYGDLNVGVWHHPYNWFNPNTSENNKKEFEKFTEKIASIHFFGHEHEHSFYSLQNKNSGDKINLLSGKLFNDDKKKKVSGFQTVICDLNTNKGVVTNYEWDGKIYNSEKSRHIGLSKEIFYLFKIKEAYVAKLEEIHIPLLIENRKVIKQSELFVFPDLDYSSNDSLLFDNYINSCKLLDEEAFCCIIEGDSQIGKSTLLSNLQLKFYECGLVPVLLSGKDIKDLDFEKTLKKIFRQQYDLRDSSNIERYLQLPIEKRVLLIDDYQDSGFNSLTTRKLLDEIITRFGKVIISVDSSSFILPSIRAELHDVNFYTIKPLGYKKRNELIERYQLLKENPLTTSEEDFIDNVKTAFDNVQSILGDKLIPSFPVYILSILQALEYKPLKQNETSFAYCYQTLVHYSLHKSGVSNDDIDSYFNFLTELAYYFISNKTEVISRNNMNEFYFNYQKEYICPSYDVLFRLLKKSKILQEDRDEIKFGYNYILYYLSAKKIADIINTTEGREIINEFFKALEIERNANILVFITHHSKDISFIEDSILNSMAVLEACKPITLERNDPFYNEIFDFANELKHEILEINRNPRQERDKMLISQDQTAIAIEKKNQDLSDEEILDIDSVVLPFKQAFRSIEILGQIVKNRKGSLTKIQLSEMLVELYTTGFRTISYVSNLFISAKDEIINLISKESQASEDYREIEKRVNKFMQMISLDACLNVFNKIMQSSGHKELKSLYNEVAFKINTPAANLVSFGINSYYGTVSPEEVKDLAEKLKGNEVALKLLRGRVKAYVYHRNPAYWIKQKFASYLNMQLSSGPKHKNI